MRLFSLNPSSLVYLVTNLRLLVIIAKKLKKVQTSNKGSKFRGLIKQCCKTLESKRQLKFKIDTPLVKSEIENKRIRRLQSLL